jgi:hypothetical protein
LLAPPGTTGNNTHASVGVAATADKFAVVHVAEVAGTTATWKVQGSLDIGQVSDANSNWFDMPYVLPLDRHALDVADHTHDFGRRGDLARPSDRSLRQEDAPRGDR